MCGRACLDITRIPRPRAVLVPKAAGWVDQAASHLRGIASRTSVQPCSAAVHGLSTPSSLALHHVRIAVTPQVHGHCQVEAG
jgi:hypothetical protein